LHAGKGGTVVGLRDRGKARPSEALLSAEEVALYFAVKATTVYRWCREGRIPCLKIGKHWRVRREQLVGFLKKTEESRGA
jgi:excisionase family DNA binding protein